MQISVERYMERTFSKQNVISHIRRPGFICRSITLFSFEKRDKKTLGLDDFRKPSAESDSPPNVDIPQARVLHTPDTDIQNETRH